MILTLSPLPQPGQPPEVVFVVVRAAVREQRDDVQRAAAGGAPGHAHQERLHRRRVPGTNYALINYPFFRLPLNYIIITSIYCMFLDPVCEV